MVAMNLPIPYAGGSYLSSNSISRKILVVIFKKRDGCKGGCERTQGLNTCEIVSKFQCDARK